MSPATEHAPARRPSAAGRRTAEAGQPVAEPRTRLEVLDARALRARSQRMQARLLMAGAGVLLAVAFGAVALVQSLVASEQLRIDSTRQQLAAAVTEQQQLQLSRAQLESPARVLALAEGRLHMVVPPSVTYLAPVATGPTLLQARSGVTVAGGSSSSLAKSSAVKNGSSGKRGSR
ncbi:MAG: hypothetical protein JWM85_767 [Acidimicrobiaceae bacterium]|nr:hypothetical protein [Acidimicrobiaceae bacterium]